MKKLLISLGVVAMMFFAQAADVNAKTCEEKAEAACKSGISRAKCNNAITCGSTSDSKKNSYCKTYCG